VSSASSKNQGRCHNIRSLKTVDRVADVLEWSYAVFAKDRNRTHNPRRVIPTKGSINTAFCVESIPKFQYMSVKVIARRIDHLCKLGHAGRIRMLNGDVKVMFSNGRQHKELDILTIDMAAPWVPIHHRQYQILQIKIIFPYQILVEPDPFWVHDNQQSKVFKLEC
ncbi:Hypothetical protein PHPALM_16453, partial [Phytophthora palmivora]